MFVSIEGLLTPCSEEKKRRQRIERERKKKRAIKKEKFSENDRNFVSFLGVK